ncbi:helix-turn-helix transcriptional regulator [Dactylosporangium sp. AC04546]|uniref:helix-turn-helix domain-containing protein n=1 Tax=Dactylosporangium sp. AC04546 TaxID=2862460 RepID=UPI001EDE154A|nr:helix-turn-helix transcriptional regulator [Dactylosporangium sp. AC04546]WVK84196.1 helix-turn-helix transcriptional regulator [Dactylosporangium sp. AC04546]
MQQIISSTAAVSDFGVLVANRRRTLGLSQRDPADRVCSVSGRATITRHELSRYERGVRLPGGTMMAVLAEVLDVPVEVLADAVTVAQEHRRRDSRTATRTS